MAFRVEISPQAFGDLDGISAYIAARTRFVVAERWFNVIFAAIRSLTEMPRRCPVGEESAGLETDVRLLLFDLSLSLMY
jgi:plasmid stabilization system protein ParE